MRRQFTFVPVVVAVVTLAQPGMSGAAAGSIAAET